MRCCWTRGCTARAQSARGSGSVRGRAPRGWMQDHQNASWGSVRRYLDRPGAGQSVQGSLHRHQPQLHEALEVGTRRAAAGRSTVHRSRQLATGARPQGEGSQHGGVPVGGLDPPAQRSVRCLVASPPDQPAHRFRRRASPGRRLPPGGTGPQQAPRGQEVSGNPGRTGLQHVAGYAWRNGDSFQWTLTKVRSKPLPGEGEGRLRPPKGLRQPMFLVHQDEGGPRSRSPGGRPPRAELRPERAMCLGQPAGPVEYENDGAGLEDAGHGVRPARLRREVHSESCPNDIAEARPVLQVGQARSGEYDRASPVQGPEDGHQEVFAGPSLHRHGHGARTAKGPAQGFPGVPGQTGFQHRRRLDPDEGASEIAEERTTLNYSNQNDMKSWTVTE